jgi:hypothetical protein
VIGNQRVHLEFHPHGAHDNGLGTPLFQLKR